MIEYRVILTKIPPIILLIMVANLSIANIHHEYEADLGSILEDRITHGEALWLTTENLRFLSIFTPHKMGPKGAVIILHGMGGHADWPEVIFPLRTALPQMGWATLSLQLPILAPGTALSEYGTTVQNTGNRIKAAITYLQEQDYDNIAIIGYSFGAVSATEYLAMNPNHGVKAFVGISMQAQDFLSPRIKLLKNLEALQIPVLDYYGTRDFDEVLDHVDDRRLAGRKNGRYLYHQMSLEGADHYYSGVEEILSRRIRGWLDRVLQSSGIN